MRRHRPPLWLKALHTAVAAIVIPSYWVIAGPTNFLWLSDTALILMIPALWWQSPLLASMMAVAVLPLELAWNVGFFWGLLTGEPILGLAGYMFDSSESLYVRILSGTFHVLLPIVLVWSVVALGYDRRAPFAQTPLTWALIIAAWFLTGPDDNVNFVHGFGHGEPTTPLPQPLHVLALCLALPLGVHVPTHLVLRRLIAPPRDAQP